MHTDRTPTLTPHRPSTPDAPMTTDATFNDYSVALMEAVADALRSGEEDVTICVPHFLQAGHPWRLLHAPDASARWTAVRAPSDDPQRGHDAATAIEFTSDIDAAAAQMLAHDRAHPFVVDWAKRRTELIAA